MKKTTKNKSSKSSKSNPPRSLKRMFPELTSVIDSKVPLLVNVRESDCAKATSLDINHCAMAKAAQRQFKVDAVVIGIATSYLIKGKKATRFKTPESVQREIVSFDRHHDFQPEKPVNVGEKCEIGGEKTCFRRAKTWRSLQVTCLVVN